MNLLKIAIFLLFLVVQLQRASAQTYVYDVDISTVSLFGFEYRVFGSLGVNLDTDQVTSDSLQFQIDDEPPLDLTLLVGDNPSGFIDFFDDSGDLFFETGLNNQNGSRFVWAGSQTIFSIFGPRSGTTTRADTPNGTLELANCRLSIPNFCDSINLDSLAVKLGRRSFDVNVRGTEGPDDILVTQVGRQIEVSVNGALKGTHNLDNVDLVEIFGFGGNDTIEVNAAVRTFISGGFGADEISGGRLENEIQGGPGPDMISGGAMSDMINGGLGRDSINAFGGDDIIVGGSSDDLLLGGAGNDTINGSLGADIIFGGPGDDVLYGNAGADSISGGVGDDFLVGQSGPDDLVGGPGMDDLFGGEGFDLLDGGAGGDAAIDQGEIELSIEN